MTPPELLLASLGSRAGFYAAQYLKKQKLAAEGTIVRVFAEKVANPPRLADFRIEIDVPPRVTDEHREGLEQAVRHCLIHNTLLNPPRISLKIQHALAEALASAQTAATAF